MHAVPTGQMAADSNEVCFCPYHGTPRSAGATIKALTAWFYIKK